MKNLRSKAIGIFVLVLLLAQLSVMAFIVWQDRSATNARIAEQVSSTARILGEVYVTRRTQSSQDAFELTGNPAILQEIRRGTTENLSRILQIYSPQERGSFVAIVDADSSIVGWASGPDARLELTDLEVFLRTNNLTDGSTVAQIGGQVLGLSLRTSNEGKKSWRVLTGFVAQLLLSPKVQSITGSTILVNVLPETTSPGQMAEDTNRHRLVLPLDKSEFGTLNVAVDFSQSEVLRHHSDLIKKLIAQAIAAFGLALLLSSILIARYLRKHVEEPVQSVRHAIRKLSEGDFQSTVACNLDSPFKNITHDLNKMREAIADRENRIMHHAEYDSLTGLTNRTVIAEKIKMALSKAERSGSVITALAIDLSGFSKINGSLGHDVGDSVLKEIARRLASNARVTDTVARVGGDEFIVILEDTDVNLAQHLAKFMVSSLVTPIHVNGTEVKLGIHAGVAFYPQHCDNAEALRRMANIALYTCKENKSSMVIYEPGQDEKHLRELAIIHDLPQAIKNNELYLQYQPKIDMETQEVKQVEALVRWRHPQLGFIPPDEFIALLERSGLIGKLTDWVFKEAIRQSREWEDAGFDLAIAVNISAKDLADERLPERLKLLLHHYLVDPCKISVEVTESAVIDDPENSVKVLNTFRKAGIKCSLDDFGTGQTSLALLKQLPISELKIDKSFVQNLRADSGDAIIVKSIIDLGHNMGLHVIAEGVESNYCWNLLNSYGCNLVQGYLVSAPLTAEELGEWHLRLQERHMNKLDLSFVQDMSA